MIKRQITSLGGYDFESNARTYSRTISSPIVKGRGSIVIDDNGREYIDCLAGAGTLALGHNDPVVIEQLTKYLDSGQLLHGLDIQTPIREQFSQLLVTLCQQAWHDPMKIHFCGPTGADAVEAAIKLFKTATGRQSVIAFHGAYHGMTQGALSVTGNVSVKQPLDGSMGNVHFFPYPYTYRSPYGVDEQATVDISLHQIRTSLTDPASGIVKPAAMILEAVQGEGGCIPAPLAWLKGISEICREFDIPLIVDEIQCGLGRTGEVFSFASAGILPDAVVLSKAVGGGLPMSLLIYKSQYDVWQPGAHTGTFRGNQMAMVSGIETLNRINDIQFLNDVKRKGQLLVELLSEIDNPAIGDIRGRGLMIGVELIQPGKYNMLGEPLENEQLTAQVKKLCYENGLIIETGGRSDAVLRFLPPLNISDELINHSVEILKGVLAQITNTSHM